MQQVDRPVELLRQDLSLNYLPPAWCGRFFWGSKYLTHDFAEIAVLSFWKQWRWSSDISNGTFFFRRSLSGCDSSLKLGMNVARYVIIPRNLCRSSLSCGTGMF